MDVDPGITWIKAISGIYIYIYILASIYQPHRSQLGLACNYRAFLSLWHDYIAKTDSRLRYTILPALLRYDHHHVH